MDLYKLYIDGNFVEAENGRTFETIDPGTGLPFATVSAASVSDAESAIAAARRAFDRGDWSGLDPAIRMAKVMDFADQVAKRGIRLAEIECVDAGHILGLAKLEPLIGIGFLRNLSHYAATKFVWQEEIPISGNVFAPGRDYIRREPIGVCVGIIPWNFPMSMAFWKIAPAIIMGNTVVIKPASFTPLSAIIIAEAAHEAGIPRGVINVINGSGSELGPTLCTHPDVDKVAFTGSTEVGREIMRMASTTIKKVTLELGGKSANIILDDADMDFAVEGATFGTFFHQGQVCESGTRVLVSSKIHDAFVDKLKKRAESLRIGYQLDQNSHMGPLVSREQLNTVENYVKIGLDEGAELLTGGERVQVPGIEGGFYYKPTVFINVNNKMRIAREEIFGPVVSIIKYDSDEEAIAIANDSIYGLAGGVFSNNVQRAERIAHAIRTGTMWINNYHIFADFCPFGGYKQSGVGREMGDAGLAEYTQIKRYHVACFSDHRTNMTMNLMSDEKKIRGFQYCCPTNVVAGHGSLSSINKEVVRLGGKRVLLLTDAGVQQAGLVETAKNALAEFCQGVYDQIPQDPDLEAVDAATEMARRLKADCIVSVGGGSVIDTAKAVCVTLKNGGTANEHLSMMVLNELQTPHIVIPTTSGTGSEVTSVAVITSKQAGRKLFLVDPYIIPNTAILDPRFTTTMPKGLTVSTGMDAMTHAIEALTSIMSNEICDAQALHAIRLINTNLPVVIEDGKNEQARLNMQIAATMAGWAFTVAQVGLAHGMAHTLGSLHHIPHGAACGVLIPKVMRYNVDNATDKLALIAQAMGVCTDNISKREAALAAADAVEGLMRKVGHPLTLSELGVSEEDLALLAYHALADTSNIFNARPVSDPTEIMQIYKDSMVPPPTRNLQ